VILRSPDRFIVSVDLAAVRARARRWLPAIAFVLVAGSGAIISQLPAWLATPKAQASSRVAWRLVEKGSAPVAFASMDACLRAEDAATKRWQAAGTHGSAPLCLPVTE
jgi:hypothetical protein